MRASRTISVDDVETAYDKSKYVHLSRCLRELSESERALVETIARHDGQQAGTVDEALNEATDLGYTRYSEIVNKLDQLGVIEADYADVEGRGRSRSLTLSYDAEAVLDRL
jgi:cell division control protein 6